MGGGLATGWETATQVIVTTGRRKCKENRPQTIVVYAASTGVFRLTYQFSPDNGTTWLVGKAQASGVVTVDGGTASYVNAAMLEVSVGYIYQIIAHQSTGGDISLGFEYREYNE